MFRQAVPEDLPRIHKLLTEVYSQGEEVGTVELLNERFFSSDFNSIFFIKENDKGLIVGTGGIRIEKIALKSGKILNAGYMISLAVLPEYRDGAFVLQYISKLFDMVKNGDLDLVFHINQRENLIEMYRRIGFSLPKTLPVRILPLDFVQLLCFKKWPKYLGIPFNLVFSIFLNIVFAVKNSNPVLFKNTDINYLLKKYNDFASDRSAYLTRSEKIILKRFSLTGSDYEVIFNGKIENGYAVVRHLNRDGLNITVILDMCSKEKNSRSALIKRVVRSAKRAGSALVMGIFPENSPEDQSLKKNCFFLNPMKYLFIVYPKSYIDDVFNKEDFYFSMFNHDAF